MNITPQALKAEYERAVKEWPHLAVAEKTWKNVPPFLLFAVGSRETNLTNETGDGGHGRGIFQLDDRSHTIPDPFPVKEQADIAAHMLHGLIDQFPGNLRAAVAAYNCGSGNVLRAERAFLDVDYYTAGRDYGRDVLERMEWLQKHAHKSHPDNGPKATAPTKPPRKIPVKKSTVSPGK